MLRRARHIGVAHHIARAIHPRPLAVPQAKHAVIFALAAQLGLLRAPKRGGGQIFVQTRLERSHSALPRLGRARHLHINRPKGDPR